MQYKTTQGRTYDFSGWEPGESPVELFDKKEWLKCLHACMIASYLAYRCNEDFLGFSTLCAGKVLEDDSLLHELCHLSLGIEISTHNTLDDLREMVEVEQCLADCWLNYSKTATEASENQSQGAGSIEALKSLKKPLIPY